MKFPTLGLLLALAGAAPALAGASAPPSAPPSGGTALVSVAQFSHQVTGVAVSPGGRVFVNFPRWTEDAPVSVAEVLPDGTSRPYPDAEWNAWRNARPLSPGDHFVCVQSVFADRQNNLWVIDPAAPNTERIVEGGPKLLRIDLATDKVAQVIAFDKSVAPQGSYLNDVRTTPDGKWAVMTDSGAAALVVVDLATGKGRRVLESSPVTVFDKAVQIMIDGHELRRPDGRSADFAADGLAIDPQGQFVYWQALRGQTLYRLAIASLTDSSLSDAQLLARVETVQRTRPADGFWFGSDGLLYTTGIEDDSVKARVPGQEPVTVAQDPRLRWPDSLAEGPDGSIYVTASHIQDTSWFHANGSHVLEPFGLWRIPPRH